MMSSLSRYVLSPFENAYRNVFPWASLLLAGFLYAVALKYFVFPAEVILTGFEGVAVSVSYYFENELLFLLLYVVFQLLLLSFGFLRVSRSFAFRSLIVVATVVVLLPFLPPLQFAQPESQNERIILVLFGGILAGVAKAMCFRMGGSTADEDILGAYFAMKFRKPVGAVAVIAGICSTAFGLSLFLIKTGDFEVVINTLMYTSIYIFVSAETLNNFFRKFRLSLITVITRQPQKLGTAITEVLKHRTFTVEEGYGGRSNERFYVLHTIVTHEELGRALEVIQRCDDSSFHYHHEIDGVSANYYISPIG